VRVKVDRAKVRSLLEERGMSQREFADISGVAAASTLSGPR
jgi:transcriptional regulator with XRE-family HTH domain